MSNKFTSLLNSVIITVATISSLAYNVEAATLDKADQLQARNQNYQLDEQTTEKCLKLTQDGQGSLKFSPLNDLHIELDAKFNSYNGQPDSYYEINNKNFSFSELLEKCKPKNPALLYGMVGAGIIAPFLAGDGSNPAVNPDPPSSDMLIIPSPSASIGQTPVGATSTTIAPPSSSLTSSSTIAPPPNSPTFIAPALSSPTSSSTIVPAPSLPTSSKTIARTLIRPLVIPQPTVSPTPSTFSPEGVPEPSDDAGAIAAIVSFTLWKTSLSMRLQRRGEGEERDEG